MMPQVPRHKVFISFHEQDIKYKVRFVSMMEKRIVDRSVDTGSIDDTGLKVTTVRQKIRDDYIADATVTIVLIGPCTWQRKHMWTGRLAPAFAKLRITPGAVSSASCCPIIQTMGSEGSTTG